MDNDRYHWGDDPYWTDALARYIRNRDSGARHITIVIEDLEKAIFAGDSPAYRAMEAFRSVEEHEGWEGYRGAPRVALALLTLLSEMSERPEID